MNVTSFVFGMLAIISVILLTGLVVGIVGAVKNGRKIAQLESFLDDFQRDLDGRFDDVYEGVDKLQSYTDSRFDDVYEGVDKLQSYTDSRFDKAK